MNRVTVSGSFKMAAPNNVNPTLGVGRLAVNHLCRQGVHTPTSVMFLEWQTRETGRESIHLPEDIGRVGRTNAYPGLWVTLLAV
jgi:hypothetical protein